MAKNESESNGIKSPLVSVIVAVKNGARYLGEAIESVESSTYRPIEIIVIDGKSTDDTTKIAKSFKGVKYILQKGDGVADAYNAGIEASTGEFISFISHDDLWKTDKLAIQLRYMIDHPEVEYTVTKVKFFLEKGCLVPSGFRRELLDNPQAAYIMETLVARKSLFGKIGKFNTKYPIAEDVDWFARARDGKVKMALIPEALVYKRIHDKNASCNTLLNNQQLLRLLKQSIDRKKSEADNA